MKCISKKKDWSDCNAYAMKDCEYCYLHNPNIKNSERKKAQSMGGKSTWTNQLRLESVNIDKIDDISLLLVDTINRVRAWEMDVKTANCIGFLSSKLIQITNESTNSDIISEEELIDTLPEKIVIEVLEN